MNLFTTTEIDLGDFGFHECRVYGSTELYQGKYFIENFKVIASIKDSEGKVHEIDVTKSLTEFAAEDLKMTLVGDKGPEGIYDIA